MEFSSEICLIMETFIEHSAKAFIADIEPSINDIAKSQLYWTRFFYFKDFSHT